MKFQLIFLYDYRKSLWFVSILILNDEFNFKSLMKKWLSGRRMENNEYRTFDPLLYVLIIISRNTIHF